MSRRGGSKQMEPLSTAEQDALDRRKKMHKQRHGAKQVAMDSLEVSVVTEEDLRKARAAAEEESDEDGSAQEESGSDAAPASAPRGSRKPKALSKKEQRRMLKGQKQAAADSAPAAAAAGAAPAASAPADDAEPKIKLTAVPLERKGGSRKKGAQVALDDLLPTAAMAQMRVSGGDDGWSEAK